MTTASGAPVQEKAVREVARQEFQYTKLRKAQVQAIYRR
jgi:hypothetical protein